MLTISHLRCEYLVDPLGLDEVKPCLSWVIESDRRGTRQVARRIQVASTAAQLTRGEADLWDSGRVEDDRTSQVEYAGTALSSRMMCYWQVRIWDDQGATSVSAVAFWTMGLLQPDDWKARWIAAHPDYLKRAPHAVQPTLTEPGTPPWLRRQFTFDGPAKRATLYASARGLIDLHLNGHAVTHDMFAPEWTDYDKRIHYRTYDVTDLIKKGENVLGVVLGDGWYSGYVGWQETRGRYGLQSSLLLQLEIEFKDGVRHTVVTDRSWRCSAGPILFSDFMMGETYDARHELTGWDKAEYDDSGWSGAVEVEPPNAVLVAQRSEPVCKTETLAPISRREIQPGVFIYDLGQNISGWVRLRVSGPVGTQVTLRHGERLNPDGTLYTENLRRAKATDVYVLRGQGQEIWEPRFTFHGFQYVELTGLPNAPEGDAVTACVVRSGTKPAGQFECSHPGVNRLWLNGLWSQKDNFLSVPTDCPQRDERLGWMGDAQVFLRTATYNMDVAAFFTKWMTDIEDAQTPEGIFPDTAPRLREDRNFVGLDQLGGGAGWADGGVIIPYTLWRVYGDRRIVERHWDAMVAWLDWLERTNPDGHRIRELSNNYGDWLCIPSDREFRTHSPMKNLLATAYWADDAAKLARMARALERETEAARFQAMFEKVRGAFQQHYLLADGRLTVETQTAYLLALAMDLLPPEVRGRAAEHLVANISDLDWHLSTGFIGISHLNPQLTLAGRADVAYRLLLQETYPGWLYPVLHGATTIWERWNGWTEKNGFFNPLMNSFNHYSLGSVGEWLYRCVAGIELDPEVNGFKRFLIRPYPSRQLKYAQASYDSIQGTIESRWQWQENQLTLRIRIPTNAQARVYVPSDEGTLILEGGLQIQNVAGITRVGREGPFAVYDVPSGQYQFTSTFTA